MKVLYYTVYFAPTVVNYAMYLAGGLAAGNSGDRTVQVTLVTPTPAAGYDDAQLPFGVVRQPGMRGLWRLLGAADIVQLAGPAFLPLALALLRGKPVVVEHHGYQASCPNGLLLYEPDKSVCPGHFLARRYHLCLKCNAVIRGWWGSLRLLLLEFPRRWMCRRVAANRPVTCHMEQRLRLPRMQVIYHGVPDLPARPPAAPRQPEGGPCFAYVGRLVSEKGLPLLLEAARMLHGEGLPFAVKFIGDGVLRAELEERARALGVADRVSFTGVLTGERFQQELSGVDAVVMPSIWEETAGLSAIEQMMRGRLVIAADIGGLGEIVRGGGLTFPPRDTAALAACMRQVIADPALAGRIGREARQRALQHFRLEQMVANHVQLYERLLAPRGEKPVR